MAAIKSSSDIAAKWSRVTPTRTEDYAAGIAQPRTDWQTATAAASDRYKDGVMKAASRGSFSKGVQRAGTNKWQQRATDLGTRRWPEGVQVAAGAYAAGFDPYAQTIKATTLPPRFPTGDPRNIERAAAMAKALRSKKESLS